MLTGAAKALAAAAVWPRTPFGTEFFRTIFSSLAPVELQRCKSNRIHSPWKKPVLSAFPFNFLGHLSFCSVQKHLSPLATAFLGNVVIGLLLIAELTGRCKGPCSVICHKLFAVDVIRSWMNSLLLGRMLCNFQGLKGSQATVSWGRSQLGGKALEVGEAGASQLLLVVSLWCRVRISAAGAHREQRLRQGEACPSHSLLFLLSLLRTLLLCLDSALWASWLGAGSKSFSW